MNFNVLITKHRNCCNSCARIGYNKKIFYSELKCARAICIAAGGDVVECIALGKISDLDKRNDGAVVKVARAAYERFCLEIICFSASCRSLKGCS